MAAADYNSVVQQLYVAYFGRPADPVGLLNFTAQLNAIGAPKTIDGLNAAYSTNSTIKTLVDQFGTSAESASLYSGTTVAFVNSIYQNVLGRTADTEGLLFWSAAVESGNLSRGKAAMSIMAGALAQTAGQGLLDKQTVLNKIAVASSFTTAVDTPAEILAYSGDTAAAAARTLLNQVNDSTDTTAFQASITSTLDTLVNPPAPTPTPQTFTLTTGVDTGASFIGGAGNDTFNAFSVGSAESFSAFDNIDGGNGNDTLNVVSAHGAAFTVPTTATVKNIETANITGDNTVSANTKGWTGLTALNVSAVGGDTIVAAATTAVADSDLLGTGAISIDGGSSVSVTATGVSTGTISVGSTTAPAGAITVSSTIGAANAGNITVHGGTTVNVTQIAANGVNTDETNGAVTVTGGSATTSVTVSASVAATKSATVAGVTANTVTITDVNAGDATKVGTISTVSVDSYTTLGIADTGLTTLNVAHGSGNIVIDNSGLTKNTNTTLNLGLNGVTGGTLDDADIYTTLNVTTGATKSTLSNITDGALTTLNVSGASTLTLTSTAGLSAVKTVTVKGAAGLSADLSGATVTSVDTSASTGTSTLTVDGSKATFTGGAGVDKITLSSATVSKAISLGGGDDTLTLHAGTTLPTASISGGAGNDTLAMNADDAHTASGSASFAAVVSGFEALQLNALTTAGNNSIDLAALGGFTSVTAGGIAIGAGNSLTLQNFAAGGTLTLNADAVTGSYVVSNSAFAAGTSDTINIALTKAGLLAAGTVDASNVENINITTADTQTTPTNPLDTLTLTSTSAKSITVSGNAGLNLTDTATTLTSVDASGISKGSFTFTSGALAAAATIKGSATGTNTVNFSAATGGAVTYTGGSGNDVITSSNGKNNVLTLGAGDNSVTGAAGNHTITAGDGNDTVTLSTGNNIVTLGNGTNSFTATSGNNTYTGGTGVDTVSVGGGMNTITTGTGADVITITAAGSNVNVYSTITDAHSGESIGFTTHGTEVFHATKVSLASTAVFQDFANEAIKQAGDASTNGQIAWFQFNGDTYIVENNAATAHTSFVNGQDYIVKLSGLVDLSTATISGHALLLA